MCIRNITPLHHHQTPREVPTRILTQPSRHPAPGTHHHHPDLALDSPPPPPLWEGIIFLKKVYPTYVRSKLREVGILFEAYI